MNVDDISDGNEDEVPNLGDSEGEEEATGMDEIAQKTLIQLVKAQEPLYIKKLSQYSGKNYNKAAAWAAVGLCMTPNMSGADVQKVFYNMRQRLGRELRKKKQLERGRSGQGAAPPFTSSWSLWDDMQFLVPHIAARTTTSTYKSSYTVPLQRPHSSLLGRGGKVPIASRPSPSPSPSAVWSSDDLYATDTGLSSAGEGTSSGRQTPQSSAAEQVLAAMKQTCSTKRNVPQPDTFAVKKKKKEEEFMSEMVNQGKAITSFAENFGDALKVMTSQPAAPPPPAAPAPVQDPALVSIQFALQSVPPEKKLQCITDILNLITSKYAQL